MTAFVQGAVTSVQVQPTRMAPSPRSSITYYSGDEEELAKENNKNTAASLGKITLSVIKSKHQRGEVIGVFESIQTSDTDLGAKTPKDVKIQGIWYAQLEE